MLERGKAADVPVAALVGSAKHALSQLHAGVDILVAAGTESGGHCGEIGTMVLVPDVIRTIRAAGAKCMCWRQAASSQAGKWRRVVVD